MSLLLAHSQRSGVVRNGLAGYYDFEKRNLIRFSQQLDNPAWGASQSYYYRRRTFTART